MDELAALARAQGSGGKSDSDGPPELVPFSRSDIAAALRVPADRISQLRAQPLSGNASQVLVLVYVKPTAGRADGRIDARLVLFAKEASALTIKAEGMLRFSKGACKDVEPSAPHAHDFALEPKEYAIGKGHIAFGIVLSCTISGPSWSGEEKHLVLAERAESKMQQIFAARVRRDTVDRVGGSNIVEEAVLQFLPGAGSYSTLELTLVHERRDGDDGKGGSEVLQRDQHLFVRNGWTYDELASQPHH